MFDLLHLEKPEDLEAYKNLISTSFSESAYNSIDYFKNFCGGLDGLICFRFQKDNKKIILPGYLKKINIDNEDIGFSDFYTPYGYTGIFYTSSVELTDIEKFWYDVKNHLLEIGVVSEFIRFNLFDNDRYFNGFIHETMLNVKGKILDEATQWNNFEPKVRKNVKRAGRENLVNKIYYKDIDDEIVLDFYNIYNETMIRTNANSFFYYSLDLFKQFCSDNKSSCAISIVYSGNIAISSELLLISNNSIFSFLGGTLEVYFDKRPNDFLKFEVINWARLNNFEYYILGGGYGYEDGIFKYKKSFFPNDIVYYKTGRLIINEHIYDNLLKKVNEERVKKGLDKIDDKDETFFPLYNKQN